MPAPRRVLPTEDMSGVLGLLHQAFAYMDGVIDPPSSLHRMALHDFKRDAEGNELWVIDAGPGSTPVACMILTDKGNTLYLGKMAVADSHRGQGLGRVMIAHAAARAQALGVPSITLQTRVELEANHETFRRFGFEEIGRTAHEGYDRPTSVTFRMGV
ncbi:GNAT family N-acetyltransferase [Cereibacter sphaeroides]|nr:GNAT family N-acetyltransferase [Cereibacter sphaeroides]